MSDLCIICGEQGAAEKAYTVQAHERVVHHSATCVYTMRDAYRRDLDLALEAILDITENYDAYYGDSVKVLLKRHGRL